MSRDVHDLHPAMQRMLAALRAEAESHGIDFLVTCTWRSPAEQAALYAQGRTVPGKVVTNAKPGQSMHNHMVQGHPCSLAFDIVPLRYGKPVWAVSDSLWLVLGELGEQAGLEWAGRWKRFREYPHFQHPQAASLKG